MKSINTNTGSATVVTDRLRHWAEVDPDHRFVQCGGDWHTYAQMMKLSDSVAAGLEHAGVQRGEHIVILLPNCIEFVVLFFAAVKIGAVQVPLNPMLRGEFLHYQLSDSEAKTIITDREGMAQVAPFIDRLPDLRRTVLVGPAPQSDESGSRLMKNVIAYKELESQGEPQAVKLRPSDLCSIIYTSGTTGMPKGCMMSNGYYLAVSEQVVEADLMRKSDVLLTPYQMCHTSGQVLGITTPLHAGASVALEPEYHVTQLLDRARETKATVIYAPTAIFAALFKQPARSNDREHNLRVLWPAHVAVEKQREMEARFGLRVHGENYGQTEAFQPSLTPLSESVRRPETSGLLSPRFEVRIVDDDDLDVPVGKVGEIVVRPRRPHGMFSGYWKKSEETMRLWHDLWHHTGDNGFIDELGYLTFADRKKDSMRRRGENVSSIELERAIALHPGIDEVACHPVPSDLAEDDIKVCIVPAPNARLMPDELFSFLRRSLPYYAIPRYVEILPELPRNPMGKVQKHKLVERGVTTATWDFDRLGMVVKRDERRNA